MSWAERLRQKQSGAATEGQDSTVPAAASSSSSHGMERSHLSRFDVALWTEILSFVSYSDVGSLGRCCKALNRLHAVDFIWQLQERYLACDLAEVRGLPKPPPLGPFSHSVSIDDTQAPGTAYQSFKRLKVLLARDIRRDWDIREITAAQHRGSRNAVLFSQRPELQPFGVLTRSLTTSPAGRILKSEVHIYDLMRPTAGPLRTHQLLTACDDVAAGLQGRIPTFESTDAQEDAVLVTYLQVGLSALQAGDNLLHTLGPRLHLIEITAEEARGLQSEELAPRCAAYNHLIEDFVINPPQTRYFVGPEFCRAGSRVGLVIIDTLRILVVTSRSVD